MSNDLDSILGNRVSASDIEDRLEELESEKNHIDSDIEDAESDITTHQDTIDEETNDEGVLSEAGNFAATQLSLAHAALEKAKKEMDEWTSENGEELSRLLAIKELFGGDIPHVQLISESDFQNFASEHAEEIGAIERHAAWPANCIDWERAANELQHDYTAIEIESTTYYYRG